MSFKPILKLKLAPVKNNIPYCSNDTSATIQRIKQFISCAFLLSSSVFAY
jgi:hypothetical protein